MDLINISTPKSSTNLPSFILAETKDEGRDTDQRMLVKIRGSPIANSPPGLWIQALQLSGVQTESAEMQPPPPTAGNTTGGTAQSL